MQAYCRVVGLLRNNALVFFTIRVQSTGGVEGKILHQTLQLPPQKIAYDELVIQEPRVWFRPVCNNTCILS